MGNSTLRLDRHKMYLRENLANSLYGVILYGCVLTRFFLIRCIPCIISQHCLSPVPCALCPVLRSAGLWSTIFFTFSPDENLKILSSHLISLVKQEACIIRFLKFHATVILIPTGHQPHIFINFDQTSVFRIQRWYKSLNTSPFSFFS